eukprot:1029856-Prorocentrum_minimum.AAC.4
MAALNTFDFPLSTSAGRAPSFAITCAWTPDPLRKLSSGRLNTAQGSQGEASHTPCQKRSRPAAHKSHALRRYHSYTGISGKGHDRETRIF